MRITMVGTGYVGLVSGACFADFGHHVVCVDKDASKIEALDRGVMPIYEPGLDALLGEAHSAGVERFCDERDRLVGETDDPRRQLGIAIRAGLPSGPEDALMRLLYEFDFLAGNSALHDELVQKMYLRQTATYRGIFAAGRRSGAFTSERPMTCSCSGEKLVVLI